MATITLRSVKGSPLTNAEVDANFSNINTELGTKLSATGGTLTGGITVPSVTLSGSGGQPGVATLTWNDTAGTLDLGLKGGNVTMQLGEELFLRVTNSTGSAIPKGSVVYITGSTGNHVNVVLSQANSEGTSSKTLGITAEAIANAQTGFVATNGIISGLDTAALTEGGAVWLSATVAGGLTSTRPSPPNHAVLIGWCVRSHASVGSLYIHIANGYEVAELHDVLLTSIANNQVLSYESASGLWKNRSLATVANTGAFSDILSKPTTLSGYGITDAPTVTGTGASGTWGISITGNAATATRLINLRTINGVGFDGTADITIADSTKLPLSGGTLTGPLSAPNFRDGAGAFNVNLGSGGTEGRGAAAGYSGGAYGGVGFNVRHTATSEQYIAPTGDTVSYLRFDGGGFRFFGSAAGAAGRTVTFSAPGNAYLDLSGNWYTAGQMYATGSQHLVLNTGNYNSYSPTLTGTGASGTWNINITGNAATTSQRNFSNDISTTGQGRFAGWYSGGAATGLATEVGLSSGQGYIFVYNRDTSTYGTLNIAASSANLQFSGSTINVTSGALQHGGNQVLHAGNYTSYVAPAGGSWYGSGLPGSRWYGWSVNGGEIVMGRDLPNNGQMGMLIDGCYIAAENNGFWSLASDNTWGSRRGFYWDGTNLNFTTNSPTAVFSTARASQITAGGSTNTDANLGVQGTSHLTGAIYYGGTVGNVNSWSSQSTSSSGTHTFSGSRFVFDRYGYGSQPLIDMQSGSITLGQPTYAGSGITVNNASADGRGINLYSGSPTSPTYGLFFAQTGGFGTYGSVYADWATYFTMNSTAGRGWIFRQVDSPINVAAISNSGEMTLRSHFEQGNNIARPNVSWSAGSTSTGMVIFYLPGTTSNYGMVHMVFDIYEYNGNAVSTVIVGGHNWSTSWYNTSANVIGQCGKEVRLGCKDGRFCVVFGTSGSSWEYGTIVLRKIHNGGFYDNVMNMTGDWSATQTTTESFTNVTGDLRALRTPASFNAGGAITQAGNQVLHAANYNSYAMAGAGYSANQNLLTSSAPTFAEVYTNGWFRNNESGEGIYNQATSNHFYSDGQYWNVGYSGTTGIRLRNGHAGTVLGYLYADTSANFGLLDQNGNWAVRVKPGSNSGGQLYNTWDVSGALNMTSRNNGLLVSAANTSSSGGAIAIQQVTGEGWTGIFCDFEPYTGWGLWHDNPNNYFSFTSETSTGSLRSFTVPSRYSGDRTAHEKFRIEQGSGNAYTGAVHYAYSYRGHGNVGGTGEASHHPAGIYSQGTNWLYGTIYLNSNTIQDCGRMNGPWTSSARCYSNEWIEFPNHSGLYSSLNGAHFYPNNVTYGSWRIAGTRNGWYGIHFDSGSTLMMNSETVGFHREGYGWQMRWASGTGYISKSSPGGGTDATILDSSNYTSYSPPYSGGTLTGTWYFTGNGNTGSSSSPALQAYSTGGNGAYMSFHRAGYYAVNMGLDSDNVFRIGGWSASANRLQMDMSGNLTMAGLVRAGTNFYADQNYGYGLVGVYASTRYQGVFAMGDSYKLPADGTGPGNLYGLAWSYPSAGGVAGNLDSHGLLVLINGGLGSAISYSIVAAGNVTAYSDERLKTNWRSMPENFVERLAQVKSGIYDRIDGEQITQVGIGAQSFQRLLPEAITKAKDEIGTLSVSYGNAAMASAVELAKEIVAIKRELEALKARLH